MSGKRAITPERCDVGERAEAGSNGEIERSPTVGESSGSVKN